MEQYKLQHPFPGVGGKMVETVEIRRLKAKDMLAAERSAGPDAGETEKGMHMLARATGLDFKEEVQELDLDDLEALSNLLGKSQGSKAGGQTKNS